MPTTVGNFAAFASALRRCGNVKAVSEVHAQIIRDGYDRNAFLGDLLVQMYGKCKSLENAKTVFDGLPRRNAFSWNIMIAAYAQNGQCRKALDLFQSMDAKPDRYTYLSVLGACSNLKALAEGKLVHARIAGEFQTDVVLQNALVSMYAKCGNLDSATSVFSSMPCKDVVSWNSIISAYVQNGHNDQALDLYQTMVSEGVKVDAFTFSSILGACSTREEGKAMHSAILVTGLHSDIVVQNALINMYAKCSSMVDAEAVFDTMQRKNVVSWTAMISAYAQHNQGKDAMQVFRRMELEGVQPNNLTFASIFGACSSEELLSEGMAIHSHITATGLVLDVFVQNALLNMYGKCGCLDAARKVFEEITEKNVVSWTAMIAAYAQQGHSKEALHLYWKMNLDGVQPNSVTFGCILVACSHAGLLDQGWICFISMAADWCVQPKIEHYTCMVDLLGRAGRVHEAEELINSMPYELDSLVWMALLGACKTQQDALCGARAAEQALEMYPKGSGLFVLLSDICAAGAGRDTLGGHIRSIDAGMHNTTRKIGIQSASQFLQLGH